MSKIKVGYNTDYGKCINSTVEDFLKSRSTSRYKNKIKLIFTSPPFPLKRKKKYGNLNGDAYIEWITTISIKLSNLLADNGSFVIEIGNAWEPRLPVMSTLPLKSLLNILEKNNFYLCQSFIWHNNAKLPTPAQWVNIDRIRVKDSFTNIWWMSRIPKPPANNRKVLSKYSSSMKKLIQNQKYNPGLRPSEHNIGEKSFLKNNGGAIPSNVLIGPNTQSSSKYLDYCRKHNIELHPARMPEFIPEFFIEFLTKTGDLVLDPFAGSNVTGFTAEKLKRQWISVEPNSIYVQGSKGRFTKER